MKKQDQSNLMVVLAIDASVAGIAGDMFTAALLDVIEEPEKHLSALNILFQTKFEGFKVVKTLIDYHQIYGSHLTFSNNDKHLTSTEILNVYQELATSIGMSAQFQQLGIDTLETIFAAESAIHKHKDPHLHEIGSVDTVFDVLATFYLLDQLQVDHIICSPIATGYGTVKVAHGLLPVPAPVSQLLLEKFDLITTPGPQGEAATPTGIAIAGTLVSQLPTTLKNSWTKSGYGFGTKQFSDQGNFLRVRLGEVVKESTNIMVLETNIDDISGEFLGHAVQQLLDAGAVDVNYYPIVMKKNRPAYTLRVLSPLELVDTLAEWIQRLTGTLGIRVFQVHRHIGSRAIATKRVYVPEWEGEVEFHIKKGSRKKIEFDDLTEIGKKHNLTPLEVKEILQKYLEE